MELGPDAQQESILNALDIDRVTQLGEQLENPYSVANMRKALESLNKVNGRSSMDDTEIITTHLYIKFKPVD